jgi:hypothetical protein
MIVVGLDVDDLVALDRDLEAAERLTDPAKRLHGFSH